MPGLLSPNIKSLILDMDGVLWKEDNPIGDLPTIFNNIHKRGLKVAFATNNSTQTPSQYVDRLACYGVQSEPWQMITSSLGMADMLSERFPEGTPVFAIGGEGLMTALQDKGFITVSTENAPEAKAVIFGIDVHINFEKMREATLLVRRGVPFFATNPDKTFPTPRGEIPGAGAWVGVIITATGKEPIYAGKPQPYLLELARKRLGTLKETTLVVGDRLETDIAGGQANGCPVALVLSGISDRKQAETWRPRPDIIARDLMHLVG
jgi:4-nitrophenyl phosphatase